MQVKFCGAAQFVTGSSHLITLDDGYKILLDCGLFQGKGRHIWDLNNTWHFDPAEIDCLILSHAHIDHTGRVPKLVKDGFTGDIHCTHATRSLCSIMLLDSAKIQERDVEWFNKRLLKKRRKDLRKLRKPLYDSEIIAPTLNLFIGYNYNRWHRINEKVSVMFRDAGHILGSSSVTLKITENGEEKLFGFTGDIGRPNRPILRSPKQMPEVDYLICESTYGDKDHQLPPEQSEEFLEILIETCVEKRGKLIIPAFSVGRTQEIVYMLDKLETAGLLPRIPIYVDSPLAVNATMIFGQHPECFDNELNEYLLIDDNPFGFNDLNYIREVNESKALNNSSDPCIIISSSGMMNAGRVKHHLFNNIESQKNTFLIVGYCSPDTPGGMLRDGIESIKLFGEHKMVKADVRVMDSFSAHGDRNEMYDFIANQTSLKKLFLVHGELERQEKFKSFLKEKGFSDIEIPAEGDEFTLN
ncbi:MAG: MBL fold metallo-hydrolase [Saprospiraceae bacterium]|nr:MBL fold metallo-hydrolase [Saprospiraceae bacterium]